MAIIVVGCHSEVSRRDDEYPEEVNRNTIGRRPNEESILSFEVSVSSFLFEASMSSHAWKGTATQGHFSRGTANASIHEETVWRRINRLHDDSWGPILAVGKWSERRDEPHELVATALAEHYTIDVLLEETVVDCLRDGHRIATGKVGFGATQIAAPGQEIACRFSRSSKSIHVFIPHTALATTYEDATQRSCPASFELRDLCFTENESVGRLAHSLADASTLSGPCAALHSESLSVALLTRLMALQGDMCEYDSRKGGLARWRQRRAVDYMEANLSRQILLQDIAEHAGLSRMHFASQFKLATGVTPHAFLLHRRIERAKQLLRNQELTLVQIAFEVGFQSQSHFTTVFRRFIGSTPGRWRAQFNP